MKLIITTIMLILLATSVTAVVEYAKQPIDITTGNADYECTQAGFDFGIAKWEWNDDDAFEREGNDHAGYTTDVIGDDQSQANWESNPAAAGVLSKEAREYFLLPGGTSGAIYQGQHGISHVTLCGETTEQVPEFGVLAALGVLGLAGLFVYRKRH